jgi:hypothetical protein
VIGLEGDDREHLLVAGRFCKVRAWKATAKAQVFGSAT